jgi:hypothetical protein
MGAQRLNAKNTRKIAGATGLPVVRAWGHGGYTHDFVTAGHLHGWYSLKTGKWGIDVKPLHYDTCPHPGRDIAEPIFPSGPAPLTITEARAALAARQNSDE